MNNRVMVENNISSKIFKWSSFVILIIVATTTLISLIAQGIESETEITDKIYSINCFLCVTSLILFGLYICKLIKDKSIKDNQKHGIKNQNKQNESFAEKTINRIWPCIILIIFMIWTAVGCIQASTEAEAELAVRQYYSVVGKIEEDTKDGKLDDKSLLQIKEYLEEDLEKNLEIANWTSGDRMPNAADRGWNGCDNLKDGYFSFLFYASIVANVIMLGANNDNLKKWILRVLLVSALIIVFMSFMNLMMPKFEYSIDYKTGAVKVSQDMVIYNRAIFNNSNHYGYYLCITVMICATMFLKEKNISFKLVSLVGFALSTLMLIINNTFGAYLGVMVALGLMFIIALLGSIVYGIRLLIEKEDSERIKGVKNKFVYAIKEFVKISVLTIILTIFSLIITGGESKIYVEGNNICKKSYIGYTFGERNILIEDSGTYTVITDSNFTLSGDNREYNINKKNLKLVKSESEYKDGAEYYKLEDRIYEIIEDETTVQIKKNTSSTIVKRNFDGLFKDIKTFLGIKDESEKNQESLLLKSAESSGKSQIRGESVNDGTEEYNEKSGLSEEISNTGSGRGEVWITCLRLIEQRPLFGWGLENLLNEFYHQYGVNEGRTHNLILQLAGTTGIIGMFLYIGAVIAIFFKVLFRFKFREYTKNTRLILLVLYLLIGIISYNVIKLITAGLQMNTFFINVCITVIFEVIVILATRIKSLKSKVSEWGLIEYVTMPTFVAYMVSSLFGNSAFYTSPYFMIILGMMVTSMIYGTDKNQTEEVLMVENSKDSIKNQYDKEKIKDNKESKTNNVSNKFTKDSEVKENKNVSNVKSKYNSKKNKK